MKDDFRFIRPFPYCPRVFLPETAILYLPWTAPIGPFNLAEAMHIFWKLKSLTLTISRYTTWSDSRDPILNSSYSGTNVYLLNGVKYSRYYSDLMPINRGTMNANREIFGELAEIDWSPAGRIYYPSCISDYPHGTPMEEREFYYFISFEPRSLGTWYGGYTGIGVNSGNLPFYVVPLSLFNVNVFGKTVPFVFYTFSNNEPTASVGGSCNVKFTEEYYD